jgi:hypothetical protein
MVRGNSYSGTSTVSGGILVAGGPGYGGDFCVNSQIVGNTLPGSTFAVDADPSFTNRAKVHANK